jgi:hypothetical protein
MNLDNFKIQIRKITYFSKNEYSLFIPNLNRKVLKKAVVFKPATLDNALTKFE